jgi:hypothetical protein
MGVGLSFIEIVEGALLTLNTCFSFIFFAIFTLLLEQFCCQLRLKIHLPEFVSNSFPNFQLFTSDGFYQVSSTFFLLMRPHIHIKLNLVLLFSNFVVFCILDLF